MTTIHEPDPTIAGEPAARAAASPWRRVTAGAAFTVAASALFITALAGEVIPPLVVIAVLFAVVATLVLRVDRPWPRYLAAVFGVLVIVGNLPFVVADLSHPESLAGFGPMLVMVLAALLTTFGGVAAARGASLAAPPVLMTTALMAVVALIGSLVLTLSLSDDEPEPGDVEIVAEGAEYPDVVVDAGNVGFLIDNADPVRHTFLIEGTDVAKEVPGATARRVEADLVPGTYRLYCDVPGHESMEATLTVR